MDPKKHESGDHSNMNDNVDDSRLISKESITWLMEKLARKEEICMPEYCKEFGLTNENDAHTAFLSLLSMSVLPTATRTILTKKYEKWRRNEGEAFWLSREADYIIEVATNGTIGDLVKRGRFYTERRLGSRPQDEPKESVQAGQKHPRDPSDDDNTAPQISPPPSRSDMLRPNKGRYESQASTDSHQLLACATSGETRPPASRASQRSSTSSFEFGETGPHSLPTSHKTLLETASSLAPPFVTSHDDHYGQLASGTSSKQKHRESRRVSFGRSLTLEDLSRQEPPLRTETHDYPPDTTPPIYSPRSSLGTDLPSTSTDLADSDFVDQGDPVQSTSRLYSWNFMDGQGRVDSNVDRYWEHNGTVIGTDLMRFRTRTVENNGGFTKAHQKLKMEEFEEMLEESPPVDRNLKAILSKMTNNSQYWNSQARNEDTYLKSLLGPFLDTYFGKLKYAKSDWTPTQDDTVDPESSTLIPDYGTATLIGEQRYFVLLLEGKIAGNTGQCQMWDDLTKLGQEMKSALDSILKLMPSGDVCVIGILVREPLTEFFSMRLHAEGTYVMHKFASAFIVTGAMNAFPILHLMEVCEHAKRMVEQTIGEIRRVKVHESSSPKVPLSWLRPSFKKPKRYQVTDISR
ncbi:hypothetical protein EC957_009496, partial [Mortierella hygrophila]